MCPLQKYPHLFFDSPEQIYLILPKKFSVSKNYFIINSHCRLSYDIEIYYSRLSLSVAVCPLTITHSPIVIKKYQVDLGEMSTLLQLYLNEIENYQLHTFLDLRMFSYSISLHILLLLKHHSTINAPSILPLFDNKIAMKHQCEISTQMILSENGKHKVQQDTLQYVKRVTYYMLIEIEFSEIKCDFQMPPGLPTDTFTPQASDEN